MLVMGSDWLRVWEECLKESPTGAWALYQERCAANEKEVADLRLEAERRKLKPVAWADKGKILAIYAEARRLTEMTGIRHEVDHMYPTGLNQHVCGLHVEQNLRPVPAEVNRAKKAKLPGVLFDELWDPFDLSVHYDSDKPMTTSARRVQRDAMRRSHVRQNKGRKLRQARSTL